VTSRERIRHAVNHLEPDRVPLDLGGSRVTGIHIDLYCNLARWMGIPVLPAKVYDLWQMLAKPDILFSKCIKSDVVVLENYIEAFGLINDDWKLWKTFTGNDVLVPGDYAPVEDARGYLHLQDNSGKNIAMMPKGGLYYDLEVPTAMTDEITKMDPGAWKESIPLYSDEDLRFMQRAGKALFENTDFAICGSFLKGGLGTNGLFAGHTIGDWLTILFMEQEYAGEILQATAERAVQNLELYLQAVGEYIDLLLLSGTDYGTQNSELFNPDVFKELHVPNYLMMTDYIHQNSNVKVMTHSCGSIRRLIPHIIDAGIDILNPVHVSTKNMDPQELKDEFGDKIVFWGGGIDTQTVLPFGSVEEVKAQCIERIDIFGPGGGFVFAPVHNLQYGVPPENIQAMVDTVLEYGWYPLNN